MFHNMYKGQKYYEIFSTNNQLLIKKWKLNSAVKKIYDDHSKTYVHCLNGKSPVPLMCWSKEKNNVNLPHTILVFQFYFAIGASVLINIGVTTSKNQRKRIIISSKQRNEHVTSLSVTLPLVLPKCEMWVHVIVDMEEVFSTTWKKEAFKNIEELSIGGILRMKRVFVLRKDLLHSQNGSYFVKYEELPRQISLPKLLSQSNIFVSHSNPGADHKQDSVSNPDSKFCLNTSSSAATFSEYGFSRNVEKPSEHTFTKSACTIQDSRSNTSHETYDINREKESAYERSIFKSENEIIPMLSNLTFGDSLAYCNEE